MKIAKRRRGIKLKESGAIGSGPMRINKEKGEVYDVKVLGFKSVHGYRYTKGAMREAIPLYEGVRVNVNHMEKGPMYRPYEDRFGSLHGIYFKEGGGLYAATFKYNRKHRLAEQFEYDVENDPENVGLSHEAGTRRPLREGSGGPFVESIDYVISVDVVADPSTTNSLFEGRRRKMLVRKKKAKAADASRRRLREADLLTDTEGGVPSTDDALGDLIKSIAIDEGLTAKQKRDKINKLLDVADDDDSGAGTSGKKTPEGRAARELGKRGRIARNRQADPDDDDDGDDGDDDEGLREATRKSDLVLRRKIDRMEKKDEIRELCEAACFRPTGVQMKALMALRKESEVKECIASFQGMAGFNDDPDGGGRFSESQRPRSRHAADDEGGESYDDAKSFVETLT